MISDKDKEYLLSLKPEDLTFSKLVEIFADTVKLGENVSSSKKSRFEPTDEMTLKPSEYFVKEPITTTVGRFIYNKYIVERIGLQDVLGYVNYELTQKKYDGIDAMIADALIREKITMKQMKDYINYRDTLGMQLNSVIVTSYTEKIIQTPKSVQKKKDELFKKYSKELDGGDLLLSEKIQNELLKDALKEIGNDPGMDLYNSGARGNLGNYKNMNIFKGATMDASTGKYKIVKSSFMDGIEKDDIASFGNALVAGSFPKSVGNVC